MRKEKIIIFLLTILLIFCGFLNGNELSVGQNLNSSFNKSVYNFDSSNSNHLLNNKIVSYSMSGDNKVRGFRNMGIAGAVTFGTSCLVLAGGLGMYIYAFQTIANALIAADMDVYDSSVLSTTANVLGLYYGGIALIAIGAAFAVLSLPLMIVGFALSSYYKRKLSISIKRSNNSIINVGLAIKL